MDMGKYNWEYLIELGYTDAELEEFESEGWDDSLLEILTDPEMASTFHDNAKYMLEFFEKDEVFRLMVRYSDAFMISYNTFISRFEQIADILGENWSQVVWKQYWEDADSILDAVGYLRDSDWEEALLNLNAEINGGINNP